MPWIYLPNFEKWTDEKKAKWILAVSKKGYSRIKTTLGGKSYYFKEETPC